MNQTTEQKRVAFMDRRSENQGPPAGTERRQFRDSHQATRPEVNELAEAIDQYKLRHRRRFITFDELYEVITGLGYHK